MQQYVVSSGVKKNASVNEFPPFGSVRIALKSKNMKILISDIRYALESVCNFTESVSFLFFTFFWKRLKVNLCVFTVELKYKETTDRMTL